MWIEIVMMFGDIVCNDCSFLELYDVWYMFFNECLVWYYGILNV